MRVKKTNIGRRLTQMNADQDKSSLPHYPQNQNQENNSKHQQRDLHRAIRPFALHFAGPRIDHHLKHFALKPVRSDPHRQQQVLKRLIRRERLHVIDLLLIPADVAAHVLLICRSITCFAFSNPSGNSI